MKRTSSFFIAIILFFIFCGCYRAYCQRVIVEKADTYIYYNSDTRNQCKTAMTKAFSKGIPLFGSSELWAAENVSDDIAYPPSLFNGGNSDFNTIMIGRGYMQSLLHAINVGALDSTIQGRKVVLILSPQWFTDPYNKSAFPERFTERNYANFLKNSFIPYQLKKKVAERVYQLLEDDPVQRKKVKLYNDVLLDKKVNVQNVMALTIYDWFMENKSDYDFYKIARELNASEEDHVNTDEIDFVSLLERADEAGKAKCSNNNLGIYDEYYEKFIKSGYENGSSQNGYSEVTLNPEKNGTEEYDDLRLFLDVCNSVNIDPMLISIPMHGKWYDWSGLSLDERENYYQRIRDICDEYDVSIADFSDKEYEQFFLLDIMHCGWKGWVYLDEATKRFASDDEAEYPFSLYADIVSKEDHDELCLNQRIANVNGATVLYENQEIKLQKSEDGYLYGRLSRDANIDGKRISIEMTSVAGEKCKGFLEAHRVERLLQNPSCSEGAKVDNSWKTIFTTSLENNAFNSVYFQIYNVETGDFLLEFGRASNAGDMSGKYVHTLESGNYKIVFKGNTNLQDEYISSIEYLHQGSVYNYQYILDSISDKSVEVSDLSLWESVEE